MVKIKGVHICVHPSFFDGWFEPKRKMYEQKLGVPMSQVKFTELMAKNFKLKTSVQDKVIKNSKRGGIRFLW